jgi:hypothetical protein
MKYLLPLSLIFNIVFNNFNCGTTQESKQGSRSGVYEKTEGSAFAPPSSGYLHE